MENITLGATITPDLEINNSTMALNALRIFFGLTAICGNLLIITCVFHYRLLRTATHVCIANLAAADFLNGCNMVTVSVMNLTFCTGLSATHYPIKSVKQDLHISDS